MSNWPPGTRNRVLFVLGVGLGLVLLAWFGAVSPLRGKLAVQQGRAELARIQLRLAQASLEKGPEYQTLAEARRAEIIELESTMAEGRSLLFWEWGNLMPYGKLFGITFRSWENPTLGEADVPPTVPYPMATFGLTGQGHFHSFGKFLAAFENSSPFIKLKSLTLQAVTPGFASMDDPEELSFRIEYHILAQTNSVTVEP
jgi:hypothetical protein